MIKRRSLLFQVVLYIVTFGIYGIYWYYSTLNEMSKFQGKQTEPLLWTILMFVPIVNLFAMWKHASTASAVSNGTYPPILLWILWIFISPAMWILVQLELNKLAGQPAPSSSSAE
jgi:hypothetical protein